jgi:glycosyltransferase involved in cell wall biosynthesis
MQRIEKIGTISLCITTYNRYESTIKSFEKVIDNPYISEIIISDDHSEDSSYYNLTHRFSRNKKVKLFRNEKNIGCYLNKRKSVELASCRWVIIFDSDNEMDENYIDALRKQLWLPNMILQPSYGKPVFDFREFEKEMISRFNVAEFMDRKMFSTMLNAHNFFINRGEYLRVFDDSIEPWTSDSEWFMLKWLEAGNLIYVTPGLEYIHNIHDHSHYKTHHKKTGTLHEEILFKLRNLT